MKKILTVILIMFISHTNAQPGETYTPDGGINFYVITKEKTHKLQLAVFSTVIRARIRAFLDRKRFYVITAVSSENAAEQMVRILERRHKTIDNLWFDSHGHYKNRYSSFRIGQDIFSYKNICDSTETRFLKVIAGYCTENTRVAIGACYAGADYDFPATDSTAATPMRGDSLMIGLGRIFYKSTVYASESWVMSKPGIFANKFAFAGYPLEKYHLDSIYAPVWKNLGCWKGYSVAEGKIFKVSTISLNRWGDIRFRERDFRELEKTKKVIADRLSRLQGGLIKS